MNQGAVVFKGVKNGINVILDEEADFEVLKQTLEQKLLSSGAFFAGTRVNITFRGRNLDKLQRQALFNMVNDLVQSDVYIFFEDDLNVENVKCSVQESSVTGSDKFYKGTIRSGQYLESEGNLVILGDVNPGAEIVAGGNIVVMGTLRGIVHAGISGNRDVLVAALNLRPTQLRIADIITRSPDEEAGKNEINPEVAFVKGNEIYIDNFLPKRIS